MGTVGLRRFSKRAGQPIHVSYDGRPEYLPYGHTIDWAQIAAAAADGVLADGTEYRAGDQYILLGTVMVRTLDADGKTGLSVPANNIAAIIDPPGAPVLAHAPAATALPAGTYYVQYAYYTVQNGVTFISRASVEGSVVLAAGDNLTVTNTGSAALPAGATGIIAYISQVSGGETRAGNAAANAVVLTALPAAGAAVPPVASALTALPLDNTYVMDETVFQTDQLSDNAGGPIIGGKVWQKRLLVGGTNQPTLAALRTACPRLSMVQD